MIEPLVLIAKLQGLEGVEVPNWNAEDGLHAVVRLGKKSYVCVASWGMGWDHLSVSIYGSTACPDWNAMITLKRLFFKPDEVAIQYGPAENDYVNIHPGVLHWWRKQDAGEIEMPPKEMV